MKYKIDWLSGLLLAAVLMACSVSYAVDRTPVMTVTAFDAVYTVDTGQDVDSSAVVAAKLSTNEDIGAGSAGLIAMALGNGSDSDTVPCMATCREKTIDNVTAYLAASSEVGWRI